MAAAQVVSSGILRKSWIPDKMRRIWQWYEKLPRLSCRLCRSGKVDPVQSDRDCQLGHGHVSTATFFENRSYEVGRCRCMSLSLSMKSNVVVAIVAYRSSW